MYLISFKASYLYFKISKTTYLYLLKMYYGCLQVVRCHTHTGQRVNLMEEVLESLSRKSLYINPDQLPGMTSKEVDVCPLYVSYPSDSVNQQSSHDDQYQPVLAYQRTGTCKVGAH